MVKFSPNGKDVIGQATSPIDERKNEIGGHSENNLKIYTTEQPINSFICTTFCYRLFVLFVIKVW